MIFDGLPLLFGYTADDGFPLPHIHRSNVIHIEGVKESRIMGGEDHLAAIFAWGRLELVR
jgi:hypothetical protein